VTLLVSVMTPGNGAIGAACEVPETAANSNAATAIAKTVLIIILLRREPTHAHNTPTWWRFRGAGSFVK
jgi:hypothetical protein